jgi:hypothetical protein
VGREGDRFVALRSRRGVGVGLRNFENGAMLRVDGMFLGYDLRGKAKDVLARDGCAEDLRDLCW